MRRLALTSVLWAGVAFACSSFSSAPDETAPPTGDAGGDIAVVDAPDAPPVMPSDLAPNCPTSRAPQCALAKCERRLLHRPSAAELPFAIATDHSNVYWAAQPAGDGAADAYDGEADARIQRTSKSGDSDTFVIADAQPATRSMALDGAYVYWSVIVKAPTPHGVLRRAMRTCNVAPCTVEDVSPLPSPQIEWILRGAPGTLVIVPNNGAIAIFDTEKSLLLSPTNVGDFPAAAVTDDAAYISGIAAPTITRLDFQGGSKTFAGITGVDGGIVPSATDCEALWAMRGGGANHDLYRFALASPKPAVALMLPNDFGAFAIAADARTIYFGLPNARGLYVWDKVMGGSAPTLLEPGNVWRIAVDDDGVYWGDHDNGPTAGTIHMIVK